MDTTLTHLTGEPARGDQGRLRYPGEIPNYEVLQFIKAGGFGDVWLARERVTGVRRAIKVLYKSEAQRAARDIEGVRRYQRCAHNHPHLLQILTVGESERCFYCVMDAADEAPGVSQAPHDSAAAENPSNSTTDTGVGRYSPLTLRALASAKGRFGARAALEMIAKLVAGVARLHEQGLAHYDLKPENILIVEGEPKIADVGLVAPLSPAEPTTAAGLRPGQSPAATVPPVVRDPRATDAPGRCGTPVYMTPQGQANDLYALGKILYELVSGRPCGEFPSLPARLASAPTRELSAAVAIMNRACHPEASRRFEKPAQMAQAIEAALYPRRGLLARWRRLSSPRRIAATAAFLLAAAGLTASGARLYTALVGARPSASASRAAPLQVYAKTIRLDSPNRLRFVGYSPESREPYPYLFVAGQPLPQPGRYVYELERPLANFVLDFHLKFVRPWGKLCIDCVDGEPGSTAVQAELVGQPDGLGLRTNLSVMNGRAERLTSLESILGHPQPGLEYVLRLARSREGLVMSLWPLSNAGGGPIVRKLGSAGAPALVRQLVFECSSDDALARAELLDMTLTEYSAPIEDPAAEVPELVRGGVKPAYVPAPYDRLVFPPGNLLAGEFDPYASEAWMSIGNWAWWSGAEPGAAPKPIRCVPFSTEERKVGGHRAETYEGLQTLRFDRARYADFQARVRIRLADPRDPRTNACEPFPATSHDGGVGLAFRMQDVAPKDCAWGGAYIVHVNVDSDEQAPAGASIDRFGGLSFLPSPEQAHAVRTRMEQPLATTRAPCRREALFAPAGFTLMVRAIGRNIKLFFNDRPEPVLDVDDPSPDYFREGRLALYASRLIATFESLEVTPP